MFVAPAFKAGAGNIKSSIPPYGGNGKTLTLWTDTKYVIEEVVQEAMSRMTSIKDKDEFEVFRQGAENHQLST
jgi:hypothetical protein